MSKHTTSGMKTIARRACAALALAVCGHGAAAEVARCVAADGTIALVDAPCPAGTRTSWTRAIAPETRSAQMLDRIRRDQRERMDDAERLAMLAGTWPRTPSAQRRNMRGTGPSACDQARRRREDVLAKHRDVDYDTRRALNDRVFAVCR